MASTSSNSLVLLNRILTLKEQTPFILVLDNIIQSSYSLTREVIRRVSEGNNSSSNNNNNPVEIIYLSFETVNRPKLIKPLNFIDCLNLSLAQIKEKLETRVESGGNPNKRRLIIVDSFNYINQDDLNNFISILSVSNMTTIYGVYNLSLPSSGLIHTTHANNNTNTTTNKNNNNNNNNNNPNKPNFLSILKFISTIIFEVKVAQTKDSTIDEEEIDEFFRKFELPLHHSNKKLFEIELNYRRKSGRSLVYKYIMDCENDKIEIKNSNEDDNYGDSGDNDNDSLLKNLTTFNLTTTSRQKLAKDQVELPYLQAQQSMGSIAGAIVYEFEKDDDYDEEDPYEDPF
ncbi:unnamed protein product [[Candida] boidinii]|uniref:Elongator complex protein 5 n=1 Tax=Candida boidinii TaxID=5477 RepID=A0A9W6T7N2_CANBO|nr:hypothetical protein B5S30_g5198 [[Candida] boidinii]GME78559.1 unnamed protein product [[Candida] boidinii]